LLAGGGIGRFYLKFKLIDHNDVNDLILLPSAHIYSIFDESSAASTSLLVGGLEPTLSLYSIGGKQHFQHLGKLASFVRERVGTAITKTVGSALNSFFGGGSDKQEDEIDHTPITSILDFNDPKRRIIRLSIDPYGKLIAAADGIGRVLLFDVRFAATAIRIWKGVRDARVAWTEDKRSYSSTNDARSDIPSTNPNCIRSCLCLALFAPLTGLLTLWEMRHGPCLRSIPVGAQCHISTILDNLCAKDRYFFFIKI
jgi:WD40 repeat protein